MLAYWLIIALIAWIFSITDGLADLNSRVPSCDPSLYFLQRAEDFLNFESSSLVNEVLEINYEEKENSRMHYFCIPNKDVKQHERLVRDPCLEFFSVTFVIFRMLKKLSILCKCSGKPEKRNEIIKEITEQLPVNLANRLKKEKLYRFLWFQQRAFPCAACPKRFNK